MPARNHTPIASQNHFFSGLLGFKRQSNLADMSAAVLLPLEITTPPKQYPAVGHCIYCPAYPQKPTKEHIIPFGLAEDSLILPRASCSTCQRIINESETPCMRATWWPFRTHIGAPSRQKEKPKSFTLRHAIAVDAAGVVQLDNLAKEIREPKDFPFIYTALRLHPPGLLVGRSSTVPDTFDFWTRLDDKTLAELKQRAAGLPKNVGAAYELAPASRRCRS
jgi:hypothetical protein